jgi:hypothetical protein
MTNGFLISLQATKRSEAKKLHWFRILRFFHSFIVFRGKKNFRSNNLMDISNGVFYVKKQLKKTFWLEIKTF